MNKLLNICKSYSGIREDITEAEEALILDLIKTEFKSLQPEDIAKAFKLNASGKYWTQIKAYQTFSPIFVGEVLGNYKEFVRKANLKPQIQQGEVKLMGNKQDEPHEQKRAYEFILKTYCESGMFPIIANWSMAYRYAEDNGFIELSIEDKEKVKSSIISEIKRVQAEKRQRTGIREDLREFRDHNVKVLCHKKIIKQLIIEECQ